MIERQSVIYGRVPRQVAADGGYASQHNLAQAKELGVKGVAFQKKRGLRIEDMVKSRWVYKKLCDFCAGIEGNISCLKRRYGLSGSLQPDGAGPPRHVIATASLHNNTASNDHQGLLRERCVQCAAIMACIGHNKAIPDQQLLQNTGRRVFLASM